MMEDQAVADGSKRQRSDVRRPDVDRDTIGSKLRDAAVRVGNPDVRVRGDNVRGTPNPGTEKPRRDPPVLRNLFDTGVAEVDDERGVLAAGANTRRQEH